MCAFTEQTVPACYHKFTHHIQQWSGLPTRLARLPCSSRYAIARDTRLPFSSPLIGQLQKWSAPIGWTSHCSSRYAMTLRGHWRSQDTERFKRFCFYKQWSRYRDYWLSVLNRTQELSWRIIISGGGVIAIIGQLGQCSAGESFLR